jgi:hypothetical protein
MTSVRKSWPEMSDLVSEFHCIFHKSQNDT